MNQNVKRFSFLNGTCRLVGIAFSSVDVVYSFSTFCVPKIKKKGSIEI